MRVSFGCSGTAGRPTIIVFREKPLDLITAPFLQGRVTRIDEHRPWPVTHRPWVMAQTWKDLLFAHWPIAPEALRDVMPPQLPLDTFDGVAWIAVTPFAVRKIQAHDDQRVHRGEIHHPPWPLQPAQASIELNTRGRQIDITLAQEPLLHYAKRQDVVFWALEHVGQ